MTMLPEVGDHGGGHHGTEVSAGGVAVFFVREAIGGAAGAGPRLPAFRLMAAIDDYKVEVMITLALVMGGYALALALHVSGPIAWWPPDC